VWPLPHTIAIRNIAIYLGATLLFIGICITKEFSWLKLSLPNFLLLCVPIYMFLHFMLLPGNDEFRSNEVFGTWIRILALIFLGQGVGFIVSKNPKYWGFILLPLILWVVVSGFLYILALIESGSIFLNPGYHSFFKYKSAISYYLLIPVMISFSMIHSVLINGNKINKNIFFKLRYIILIICIINIIGAHSLLGIITLIFMGLIILIIIVKYICIRKKLKLEILFFLIILLILNSLFILYDKDKENKMSHLISDVIIAYNVKDKDISTYRGSNTPTDTFGRKINASTYERVIRLKIGAKILLENPLGFGFTNLPLRWYLDKNNPNDIVNTHSGWLDFALGAGIPGLLLVWSSIVIILIRANRVFRLNTRSLNALSASWVISEVFCIWLIAELCEKEFLELLFFAISFSGSIFYYQYLNISKDDLN